MNLPLVLVRIENVKLIKIWKFIDVSKLQRVDILSFSVTTWANETLMTKKLHSKKFNASRLCVHWKTFCTSHREHLIDTSVLEKLNAEIRVNIKLITNLHLFIYFRQTVRKNRNWKSRYKIHVVFSYFPWTGFRPVSSYIYFMPDLLRILSRMVYLSTYVWLIVLAAFFLDVIASLQIWLPHSF